MNRDHWHCSRQCTLAHVYEAYLCSIKWSFQSHQCTIRVRQRQKRTVLALPMTRLFSYQVIRDVHLGKLAATRTTARKEEHEEHGAGRRSPINPRTRTRAFGRRPTSSPPIRFAGAPSAATVTSAGRQRHARKGTVPALHVRPGKRPIGVRARI